MTPMMRTNGYLRCPICGQPIHISWSTFPQGFRFECLLCTFRSEPSRDIAKAWRHWIIACNSDHDKVRACDLMANGTNIRREHLQRAREEVWMAVGYGKFDERGDRKMALEQIGSRICKELEHMDRVISGIEPPKRDMVVHNTQTVLDEIAATIREVGTPEAEKRKLLEIWLKIHGIREGSANVRQEGRNDDREVGRED